VKSHTWNFFHKTTFQSTLDSVNDRLNFDLYEKKVPPWKEALTLLWQVKPLGNNCVT